MEELKDKQPIFAPGEALFRLPVRYKDYRNPTSDLLSRIGRESSLLKLRVIHGPTFLSNSPGSKKRNPKLKAKVTDGISQGHITVFANEFLWRGVKTGDIIQITGKVVDVDGNLYIRNCELVPRHFQGRLVPIYDAIKDVCSSDELYEAVDQALLSGVPEAGYLLRSRLREDVPQALRRIDSKFRDHKSFFWAVHRPESIDELRDGVLTAKRLAGYSVLRDALNSQEVEDVPESTIPISDSLIEKLIEKIPHPLTGDQRAAINDIVTDLRAGRRADRLLSGDVGVGKTLPMLVTLAATHISGHQAAIMLPNSLLAEQVRSELQDLFPEVKTRLIVNGTDSGENIDHKPLLIGTSALISWAKKQGPFFSIQYLAIDESHKAGANSKIEMVTSATNVVEATATAIPRTMAHVLFGNKAISIIRECPVEKQLSTTIVGPADRAMAFDAIKAAIEGGNRAMILYPAVEQTHRLYVVDALGNSGLQEAESLLGGCGGESLRKRQNGQGWSILARIAKSQFQTLLDQGAASTSLRIREADQELIQKYDKSSVDAAWAKWEAIFPGRVALLHGRMSPEQKMEILRDIRAGKYDCIVTTLIAECGISMKRLSVLHVVDAERLGVSSIHQIRGRLRREGGFGQCFLGVKGIINERTRDRLELLVRTTDGFALAEEDMKQRGFGDLKRGAQAQAGFRNSIFDGHKLLPEDVDSVLSLLKNSQNIVKQKPQRMMSSGI